MLCSVQPDRIQSRPKRVLFLGRIHPTKGVDRLLEAWHRLGEATRDWELIIAGPLDQPYAESMIALKNRLGLSAVSFLGEVTGDAKQQLYSSSNLFVLPTHSENFGMAVAEALAHGIPAIVTRGAPWEGLQTHCCGWWIEQGVEALVYTLAEAIQTPPDILQEMGLRGREWMGQEFAWPRIGQMMAEFYLWLLGKGERPAWVVVN